jgi:predicted ATP-dependent endonuclease of OLD family
MKVGKASASEDVIAPLHLVLIEEPEAHLHAQVQQVFINNAYAVLRRHGVLGKSKELRTQLVISTHSSHVAHEADFGSLRYFRRLPAAAVVGAVPFSAVVNLSEVFGSEVDTARFVKRYIKATHCDLFFADGAILVEGPAERILVPHLIRSDPAFANLRRCYLTWLEIGGSHAHRLKPLLLHLGLNTLIITDIDAKEAKDEKKVVVLKRGAGYRTRNQTLKTWIPGEELLDTLLDTQPEQLLQQEPSGYAVRVAYQQPVTVTLSSGQQSELFPNTFEDALLYENLSFFADSSGTGLLADFATLAKESKDATELADGAFKALASGSKAELALELLARSETDDVRIPSYIRAGLVWLMTQLKRNALELTGSENTHA